MKATPPFDSTFAPGHGGPRMPALVLIGISKSDVTKGDTGPTLQMLNSFICTPDAARINFQRCSLSVSGYDDDPRPLSRISEVRAFLAALEKDFPHWLFLLNIHFRTHIVILRSLLPTDINIRSPSERKILLFLLLTRWINSMTLLAESAGIPVQRVCDLLSKLDQELFVPAADH